MNLFYFAKRIATIYFVKRLEIVYLAIFGYKTPYFYLSFPHLNFFSSRVYLTETNWVRKKMLSTLHPI